MDQESGFDLYERDSDLAATPPDIEAQVEMEVNVEAETDVPVSSEVAQTQDEPDSKSGSHSPSFHSGSTTEQTPVSKPKFENAPAIKHDHMTVPTTDHVTVPTIGLCEPPDSDPSKLYCLCQEPATFSMIPCHKCQNWFHGECVGLTRQKATTVKQFFCPLCIDKDPSLVTTFESRAEREAMLKKERGQQLSGQSKGHRKSGKKHSRR